VPVFQCFFIVFNVLSGGIYYREMDTFTVNQWIVFPLGVAIILYGVLIMSSRKMAEEEEEEEEDEEAADENDDILSPPVATPTQSFRRAARRASTIALPNPVRMDSAPQPSAVRRPSQLARAGTGAGGALDPSTIQAAVQRNATANRGRRASSLVFGIAAAHTHASLQKSQIKRKHTPAPRDLTGSQIEMGGLTPNVEEVEEESEEGETSECSSSSKGGENVADEISNGAKGDAPRGDGDSGGDALGGESITIEVEGEGDGAEEGETPAEAGVDGEKASVDADAD